MHKTKKRTPEQIAEAKQAFKDETYFDMSNLLMYAHMLSQKPTPYADVSPELKASYARIQKSMDYIKRRMRIRCRRHYGKLMYPNHEFGRNAEY